jgi:wyosine [tRNA(Phe)-imidazoG37] synthetase (radical SAM superfamily)
VLSCKAVRLLSISAVNRPEQLPKSQPIASNWTKIEMSFGEPRNFLNNRFIYLVVSQRARGLSIGVNLSPSQLCNFRCVYCEVQRSQSVRDDRVNTKALSSELKTVLDLVQDNKLHEMPCYRTVPEELLQLRNVALSGNGEPTLCPIFSEVVQDLIHLRALGRHPFFKLVLITNGSGLDLPEVQNGLSWFTAEDEVWAKLDVGTQEQMERINRPMVPLEKILANILLLGKQRPVVIQSLFPLLQEQEPPEEAIEEYVRRLAELKAAGANISLIQVYSAHRPTAMPTCRHLSLQSLSHIAHRVHEVTGLRAEVF